MMIISFLFKTKSRIFRFPTSLLHRPPDLMGSPLVNQDGMALFGHGRDSRPVVNPKDKVLMIGGKPVLGLDLPHLRTTTATTTTTTTTTTLAPTTTPEPTTTEWFIEESTTALPFPTCPPGTFSKTDEYGYPLLDPEGILDCYPEGESLREYLKFIITHCGQHFFSTQQILI